MKIKKEILQVVYQQYKDLENRVKKFNDENKVSKTAKEALEKFDTDNYMEGVDADSRIHEIIAMNYWGLKYVLFYDYAILTVDFSNNKPTIDKACWIYGDKQTTEGIKINIDELCQRLENEEKFE